MYRRALALLLPLLVVSCTKAPDIPRTQYAPPLMEEDVFDAETAFAQTMADRHFEGFRSFLAEDVVFFSGAKKLRGKDAVADAWEQYFLDERAPFAWQPDRVAAISGKPPLALSRGPVTDPGTGEVLGTFTSVWRLNEETGEWKVILDIGGCACDSD